LNSLAAECLSRLEGTYDARGGSPFAWITTVLTLAQFESTYH
jgi:hypothetical protein